MGRYTAAAIASFAFRLPYPVIDGNVYRFVSRLYGIATPIGTDAAYSEFESLLMRQMDRRRPDRFNAALMDFGSLQCKPVPDCAVCPFADECVARRTSKVDMLPVKPPKVKVKDRYLCYFDLSWSEDDKEYTLLQQRTGRDIWRGLYQFPLMETDAELDGTELEVSAARFAEEVLHFTLPAFQVSPPLLHQLTHRTLHVRFLRAELMRRPSEIAPDFVPVARDGIKKYPVSRLIDKYLRGL